MHKKSTLNVLDFGGSAGIQYLFAKKLLGQDTKIKWHIVETEMMVNEAKKNNLENEELKFFTSIDAAKKTIKEFDLAYANSALTYTDDPIKYLQDLLNVSFDTLYITRTPLNEKSREHIIGLQLSKLSENVQWRMPENLDIQDELVKIPFTAISKEVLEEMITKYGEIKFFTREEKGTYWTKIGNFNMFGYVLKKTN